MEHIQTNQRQRRTRTHKAAPLSPRERRRLAQLCICAVLFLAVFLGRGILPGPMEAFRQNVLQVLRSNTDFAAVFADLGHAIEDGTPVGKTLSGLWVEVFAGGAGIREQEWQDHTVPSAPPLLEDQIPPATISPDGSADATDAPVETSPMTEPEPIESGAPALGLEATTSPVMAVVSSGYGWREDPLGEGEKFHSGVDLAAPYGDPIGAFADGVVDYIGESPAYGQYLQLQHAGGVTSFYAHCSELLVQPGWTVSMGDTVARVGDTGDVTGPHLHFELKVDGERVDPLEYIDYLEAE